MGHWEVGPRSRSKDWKQRNSSSTSCVPGCLYTLLVVNHLILKITPWGTYSIDPQFIEVGNEGQVEWLVLADIKAEFRWEPQSLVNYPALGKGSASRTWAPGGQEPGPCSLHPQCPAHRACWVCRAGLNTGRAAEWGLGHNQEEEIKQNSSHSQKKEKEEETRIV